MRLVSVILPVYHFPHLVEATVRSVLAQSYSHFELLLVEDGSPDGCDILCDSLALQDNRIRVFHQPNRGAWAARNTGLRHAKGDYILFVDADDLCHREMVSTLVCGAEHGCYDFVRCRFARFSGISIGTVEENFEPCGTAMDNISIWQQLILPLVGRLGKGPMLCGTVCTTLFRRKLIEENRLRFCDEKYGEDLLFILAYLSYCNTGQRLEEVLYFYRHTPGSVTCGAYDAHKEDWLLRQNKALLKFGEMHGAIDENYQIRVAARLLDGASVLIKETLLAFPYSEATSPIFRLLAHAEFAAALHFCKRSDLPFSQRLCYLLATHSGLWLLTILVRIYSAFSSVIKR